MYRGSDTVDVVVVVDAVVVVDVWPGSDPFSVWPCSLSLIHDQEGSRRSWPSLARISLSLVICRGAPLTRRGKVRLAGARMKPNSQY